ncbi:MAG: DivIVA domain-containing protein [Candidatus Limivicinus sp.]
MALDENLSETFGLEIVKKKYYNANKVRSVLLDLLRQIKALKDENHRLSERVAALSGQKDDISEAVMSAQRMSRDIVSKANRQADEIVEDARSQRQRLLNLNVRQQEETIAKVENGFRELKEQHMAAIEKFNLQWQEFLCGLNEDELRPADPLSYEYADGLPCDLHEKVDSIAKEMQDISALDD